MHCDEKENDKDGAPSSSQVEVSSQSLADEPIAAEPQGPKMATSALSKAVATLWDSAKSAQDRLLRVAADFENFKKRSRREFSDSLKRAEEKVVLDFIPILDNLERALSHAPVDQGTLLEGVGMVQKQFLALLERYEIKPFDPMDRPFDPERMEALQQANSERPPGTVCMVLQKGYLRGERLVRPSLVVVSLGPQKDPALVDRAEEARCVEDDPNQGNGVSTQKPEAGKI
jgi:molecular chaperone GrpE